MIAWKFLDSDIYYDLRLTLIDFLEKFEKHKGQGADAGVDAGDWDRPESSSGLANGLRE